MGSGKRDHQRPKNRHRGAQAARTAPAAPSRPSALRPVACPVARPLGLAPLWARGRGVCSAPFGSPRSAAAPPACAPCSSLPFASDALPMRPKGAPCADGRELAANNRALVPPGLRRRRPPRRRAAVRWRGRAVSGARGDGAAAPAPAGRLSVGGLVGLAAGRALPCVRVTGWRVAFAPFRRGRGAPPAACLADGRSACRGVGQSWAVHFASGRSPSPAAPTGRSPLPLVGLTPFGGSPPSGNFSGGRGTTSRVLWPLAKVGCARGARPAVAAVSAVCLPASGRARSACRAVCALPRLRAAGAPVVWWSGAASGEGGAILQRERMGDGHAPPALRSPPLAAIKPETTQKSPRSDQ